jgi:hypothetical protein
VNQARFQKQQREKARRERAAAKFAKRAQRDSTPEVGPAAPVRPQAEVLAELTDLHEQFEAGLVTFDDFEAGKERLTAQLDVG